jgi:hypothetical protein
MLNIQYPSAQAVYSAFALEPVTAPKRRSGPPPKNPPPTPPSVDIEKQTPADHLAFLQLHAEPVTVIDFAAHMLPKREVIRWGYRCAEQLARHLNDADEKCLKMVEAWLRDPSEHRRRGALQFALGSSFPSPAKMLTLAVAGTSGSLTPEATPAPPVPSDLTPRCIAGALKLLIYGRPSAEWPMAFNTCMAECRDVMGLKI